MPGLLKLLFNNQVVRAGRYKDESAKSKLWQSWKKYYGPAYLKAELKDEPDGIVENPAEGTTYITKKSNFKKGSLPVKQKYYTNPRKKYSRYLD